MRHRTKARQEWSEESLSNKEAGWQASITFIIVWLSKGERILEAYEVQGSLDFLKYNIREHYFLW